MFTRPAELDEEVIVERLSTSWGLTVEEIEHQAVGFGSHHWLAHEPDRSWFVTIDDLDVHLRSDRESRRVARERLSGALETAHRLRLAGHDWVVAPVPSRRDAPVLQDLDDRFACAIHPVVEGRSSSSGEHDDADERRVVVSLPEELHRAERSEEYPVASDDHVIPHRPALDTAVADAERRWTTGPFADRTRFLLAEHRDALNRALLIHDEPTIDTETAWRGLVDHLDPTCWADLL